MSLTKIHRDQMFLDSVASSFYREVYIHNVPQQFTTGITIYAGYLTKPLEGKHPASYRVPSTIPNSQELRPDDPEAATACVFVGMTPSPTILAEIKILRKQQASVDKRTTRGRSVKSLESKNVVDAIMHDTNALRVVAKKDGKTACFYSLINPNEKGLCTGVLVPGEDVFFFKACRDDDAKTVQARKDTSGAKIRDLMYGNGEHGPIYAGIKRKWIKKEEHERDVKLARILPAPLNLSGDGDDIVVKKAQLMNIMGVLMTARKEANWNSLDVAISLMRTIEQPSLPDEPASGLFEAKFVPPTKITNELCARVHSDIKILCPELVWEYRLTTQEIQFVLEGMRKCETQLRMAEIKPYFLGFIGELRRMFTTGTPDLLEQAALNNCTVEAETALIATRATRRMADYGHDSVEDELGE